MSSQEVLIVDDDRSLLEMMRGDLSRERFAVQTATSVPEAMERLNQAPHPDAMVLDICLEPEPTAPGLPDDGIGLLQWLRRETDFPIIMLSGTDAESIKVLALDLGADDYVTKPFGGRELAARLRAVLRRVTPETESILRFRSAAGDHIRLMIDPARHAVRIHGQAVRLTHAELGILNTLAAARGRVLSRPQLLDAALGTGRWVSDRTIDVHIRRLREKIEDDPSAPEIVLTVRGLGYRFGLVNA